MDLLENQLPVARLLVGRLSHRVTSLETNSQCTFHVQETNEEDFDNTLKRFWELHSIGMVPRETEKLRE